MQQHDVQRHTNATDAARAVPANQRKQA